uniref:Dynein light chain n=1 Tax=Trichobilharzia regenti TaxID=157069 RepID=A0AA85JL65_TRIRE|nr:unnamed protein product [Trichobilharzia regenti]
MDKKLENRRALMKSSDMQAGLQKIVVDTCAVATEQYDEERDIAAYVKKHMDKYDGGVWHCVLGKNFGCYVCHMDGYFSYFEFQGKSVIIFRTQ